MFLFESARVWLDKKGFPSKGREGLLVVDTDGWDEAETERASSGNGGVVFV